MRSLLLTTTVLLAASSAFAYKPTVEREFDDVALHGCSNHDADFMVRGMVSAATEETLVLSDPRDERKHDIRNTARQRPARKAKGVFTKGKYEASAERLNQLRSTRSPVVVTLECKGNGTPVARNISFANSDGTQASISF